MPSWARGAHSGRTRTRSSLRRMRSRPGGAECLPSMEQAIRQRLRAAGGGTRQGEAAREVGGVEGTPVQEREHTLQDSKEGRQSGAAGQWKAARGRCRLGGEHTGRWQCRLHGTGRTCELAFKLERGQRCSWEWRQVGTAERLGEAQIKQAVTHTEGGWREHPDRGRGVGGGRPESAWKRTDARRARARASPACA